MRRSFLALGGSMLALALTAGPAAADPTQEVTGSTGAAQVGAVNAAAPVRVASDGNDAGSRPTQASPQTAADSQGGGQAGSVQADAPVRVLSDGDQSAATPPVQPSVSTPQDTGSSTGNAQVGSVDRGADHRHNDRMRRLDITRIADPLADHQATNQTRDARVDMDHGAAGEIERSHPVKISGIVEYRVEIRLRGRLGGIVGGIGKGLRGVADRVRARPVPNAMRDGEINEGHPKQDKNKDRREFHAFGERADNQGGGNHGEGHLKHHIGIFGNDDAVGKGRRGRIRGHSFEKRAIKSTDEIVPFVAVQKSEPGTVAAGARDQFVAAFPKGERIAVKAPNDPNHRHNRENLGGQRGRVFRARHTGVEKRETRNRHHQDERRRGQHPGGIAFIGHGGGGIRVRRSGRACGQKEP